MSTIADTVRDYLEDLEGIEDVCDGRDGLLIAYENGKGNVLKSLSQFCDNEGIDLVRTVAGSYDDCRYLAEDLWDEALDTPCVVFSIDNLSYELQDDIASAIEAERPSSCEDFAVVEFKFVPLYH